MVEYTVTTSSGTHTFYNKATADKFASQTGGTPQYNQQSVAVSSDKIGVVQKPNPTSPPRVSAQNVTQGVSTQQGVVYENVPSQPQQQQYTVQNVPVTQKPTTSGIDTGDVVQKTVIGGLTQSINYSPLFPITISKEGKTEVNPFKIVTVPLGIASDIISGTPTKGLDESKQAGEAIYNKMTPQTREFTTGLGLLGGGIALSAGAGIIAGGSALVATTGLGVSTAIAGPPVGKELVRGIEVGKAGGEKNYNLSFAEQKLLGTAGFANIEAQNATTGIPTPLGTTDQILTNMLPASTVYGGKNPEYFKEGAYQKARELGYSEEESRQKAEKAFNVEAVGGAAVEVASLAPIGAIGEVAVRQGVKSAIAEAGVFATKKEAVREIGAAAFKSAFIPAGVEGASLYTSQQISRREEVTPEGLVISGGLSALTGGFGARFIAQKSITNPKLAGAIYKGLWVVQPDEPAGDVAADVIVGGSKNMVAYVSKKPVVITAFTPTVTVGGTPTTSVGLVNQQGYTNTTNSIYSPKAPSFTDTVNNTVSGFTNSSIYTQTDTGTETYTPTPTPTTTQTTTNTITNVYNESQSTTETATNTFTNTLTATETMAATGNLPFFPLLGTGGTNQSPMEAKTKRREATKFYDEVSAAFSAGFGSTMKDPFKPTRKKGRSKLGKWTGRFKA